MNCPICQFSGAFQRKLARCVFSEVELERFVCPQCDVIFGPMSMIGLSTEAIKREYETLYASYAEGNTTSHEILTFMSMKPVKTGRYLNFGAGKWSNTEQRLREQGYDVAYYDPFVQGGSNKTSIPMEKYDGLFSHNVIEHFQEPLSTFMIMTSLLRPGGRMAHSTPCYEYLCEKTKYHLFFFLGRSIGVVAEKCGLILDGNGEILPDGNSHYFRKNFIKVG